MVVRHVGLKVVRSCISHLAACSCDEAWPGIRLRGCGACAFQSFVPKPSLARFDFSIQEPFLIDTFKSVDPGQIRVNIARLSCFICFRVVS